MVQQTVQGASATYAEELSAPSLDLKCGGFEALVTGMTTEMQPIDVNERITDLKRLNPTSRPTMWTIEWFESGRPGLFAAKLIFERSPSTLANLSRLDLVIQDGYAKITVNMKLVNSIESKFNCPPVSPVQQLLVPIRDAMTSGLKVPLSGTFQRLFMISYLDEEILIIRHFWST
ncbi:hypothetical protein F0562_015846 [Nyssa sinensis]|uniref:Plastid lipid-associated protein/fibrillin conserved domain-containing protein n=1 Tax=Nyssa sinensis TaxID=561372 RepID=A0A5J4ZMG0_9ASTE|nr:hypothetical protein F0562_015846 [Nyssa sinensis]